MEHILYGFWAMFWTLNGLDKFFNGTTSPDGTPMGWFGVTRDAKMIGYFGRLYLPEEMAIACLYSLAVVEVIIGLTFCWLLVSKRTPKVVHRMAFKASMLVFLFFSTGDILFGDRAELWEHGTFMILALVSFRLYLDRAVVRREVMGLSDDDRQDKALRLTKERLMQTVEFDEFLRQLADEEPTEAGSAPAKGEPDTW
jgi:hypothetical protein